MAMSDPSTKLIWKKFCIGAVKVRNSYEQPTKSCVKCVNNYLTYRADIHSAQNGCIVGTAVLDKTRKRRTNNEERKNE